MSLVAAASVGHVAERVGLIAVALLAAAAVLLRGRERKAAMLAALALTPVLLVAAIWNSSQIHSLRNHPALAAAAIAGGLAIVALAALVARRRPALLPLAAVAAAPFRLPISAGGHTSNLLVPLYVVVAAGVLAYVREGGEDDEPASGMVEWALMALVVTYAVQATYSSDFNKALQQVVFFYVPFALLYVLLRRIEWSRELLVRCVGVIAALAVAFALIGFVEYSRHELLLNPKVISANELAAYFRVNSLFFDPNIYGRFLALVMVVLTVALLWTADRRHMAIAAGLLAVLWAGLMTSVSQSSIVALLVGLAIVGGLRWSARRALELGVVLAVAAAVFLAVAGSSVHFNLGDTRSADNSTSGRYTLVKGGVGLFGDRPVFGFGSGSFAKQYRAHERSSTDSAVSASHTIPITVAAEEGAVGLLIYLALVIAALRRLFAGVASDAPGRIAVAAAFTGLLVHTMLYADFLEDPFTWILLAVGTALWWVPRRT